MTPTEHAAIFHDCLRSNCEQHETYDDCEKALVAQIAQAVEEDRAAHNNRVEKVVKEIKAEAYENAAKIVGHEAVHTQDTCDRCDYARKIRARAKEMK